MAHIGSHAGTSRYPVQVVREVNALRAPCTSPAGAPGRSAAANSSGGADAFAELHPGGRLELEAGAGAKAFSPACTSGAAAADRPAPRFRATVVDLQGDAAEKAVRPCGVFIVPQVRGGAGTSRRLVRRRTLLREMEQSPVCQRNSEDKHCNAASGR